MSNNLNFPNLNYFRKVKDSIMDPMGRELSDEVNWLTLDKSWGSAKFPVVISGEGDPVLLLHGFDSCFLEYRRIHPILKKHFKLIIPDLFGFGFAPRNRGYSYNPENIISNLVDLLKELDFKKNIKLVGASMGGSVALLLSNKIPNQIEKISLLSPAGLFGNPKSLPFPLNQIGAIFLGSSIVRKNLCRQAFAFPDKSVGLKEEQIASIHTGCPKWRDSLASFAKSGGFGGNIQYMSNIPTKTICGENDRILGLKELQKLQEKEKLNYLNLKNCGHLPHLDLPEMTGKILIDFFKSKYINDY